MESVFLRGLRLIRHSKSIIGNPDFYSGEFAVADNSGLRARWEGEQIHRGEDNKILLP
jgi:hypothetical protein